jgi:uncharacterized membrane-anchored protein
MRKGLLGFLGMGLLLACVSQAPMAQDGGDDAEPSPIERLNWQVGPTEVEVPGGAVFKVPEGFAFLDEEESRKFADITQNIPGPGETTFAPVDLSWFAVFQFDEVGYIKDQDEIDAEAILTDLRANQLEANKELAQRGWSQLSVDGWAFPPRYDGATQRLEWAVNLTSLDTQDKVVNFNTRVLGRRGYMRVVLVAGPDVLEPSVASFKTAMEGFAFQPTEAYAAFQQGDRIAEYGLAALIVGGAAAAASKSSAVKSFLKFILLGIAVAGAAAWGWIKRLLGGGGKSSPPGSAPPPPN